jgi:hypothetical protein
MTPILNFDAAAQLSIGDDNAAATPAAPPINVRLERFILTIPFLSPLES